MSDNGRPYQVVCTDCTWDAVFPTRDTAEHAKRIHERRYDHDVSLDYVEDRETPGDIGDPGEKY